MRHFLVRLKGTAGYSFDEQWAGRILPCTRIAPTHDKQTKVADDYLYQVTFPVPPSEQVDDQLTWAFMSDDLDILLTEYI